MACEVIASFDGRIKLPIYVCQQEEELKHILVKVLKDKILELICATATAAAFVATALIYKAKTMEETRPLAEYGIKHKSEVQVVMRCDGGLELIAP